MSSSEIELLSQLKENLVMFLDELIQSFPEEADFVVFRIFVENNIPTIDIMNYITLQLCPLTEMVKKREEQFFLNHNILFENFDDKKTSKVNYLKQMWSSGRLDQTEKDAIWRWFDSFIYLGNKYLILKKNSK